MEALTLDLALLEAEAPKFRRFYDAVVGQQYRRLLWVSSVRGGKTATVVYAMVSHAIHNFMHSIGNGQYLLGGNNTEAVVRAQRLYWIEICKRLGLSFRHVRGSQNYFAIDELDAKFHIFGGSKKGSDDALLGQTVTSAYLDEGSTLDEGFLLEVERRLTFGESMLMITSNGGAPLCGMNETMWNDGFPKPDEPPTFRHLTHIDDNPYLVPDRRRRYKAENMGSVGYAQRILGLFVAPEGLVVNIPPDAITSERPDSKADKPTGWVSVDVGETGVTAMLLWTKAVDGSKFLISEEYVWNAQRQGIRHWDDMIDDVLRRWNIIDLTYDPAAPMFASFVRRKGITTRSANNDMAKGWPALNNALVSGKLLVHIDCSYLLRECASLEWSTVTSKPKSDQPRHGADALRYGTMRLIPPVRVIPRVAKDVR